MKEANIVLDDRTLAAYIAGSLSAEERAAVTSALVRDPEAREVLAMATQALAAAKTPRPSAIDATDRRAEMRSRHQALGRDEKKESTGGK